YELYRKILDNDFIVYGDIVRTSFGHRYSHWNTMRIELYSDNIDTMVEELFELDYYDNNEECQEKEELIENLLENIERIILIEIQTLSRKLEKDGYEQIDYYYSDEVIDKTIITNEYEFTSNGKRW